MNRPLVIFGATSQARLAALYFETDSDWRPVAFCVDREHLEIDQFCGRPTIAFEDVQDVYPPETHDFFVAIGYTSMNRLRAQKYHEAKGKGYRLASYVSSRCTWLAQDDPGDNCLILEDNTIQPGVRIGNNVTLWSGNHVGHDSTIADHVFIASHAVISGFCRIGSYSFLGVNCTLRDDLTIAEGSLIGAGAAIMGDTEPDGVYLPPRAVKIDKLSHELEI
jgi:sugar O-acyltransferase (sialic acid O-acetyltransferase NeuD family)